MNTKGSGVKVGRGKRETETEAEKHGTRSRQKSRGHKNTLSKHYLVESLEEWLFIDGLPTPDYPYISSVHFSHSVMSDSAIPWNAARQASLSITNSQSLLKLLSIE